MSSIDQLAILILILSVGLGIGICYLLLVIVPRRKRGVFQKFANGFGLTYDPKGDAKYKGILPGNISNLIRGTDSKTKQDVRLFHVLHLSLRRRSLREAQRTVVAISIRSLGVHVYMNSKINYHTDQLDFTNMQRYETSGDLAQYFNLYFPAGLPAVSLPLFNPNTLDLVMAKYAMYDIEINDNELYVYDFQLIEQPDAMEQLYKLGLNLAMHIDSSTSGSIDINMVGPATDPRVFSGRLEYGVRMAPKIYLALIMFALILFPRPVLSLIDSDNKVMALVLLPPLVCEIVWWSGIYLNKRQRRDYQNARLQLSDKR